MNAVKRGFFSLWYRKKTALLLFCVFLILAALVLAGFSMLEACRQEERTLREQVGATVTLNNYHTEEADLYAAPTRSPRSRWRRSKPWACPTAAPPYYYSFAQKSETLWPFATPGAAGEVPPGVRLDPGGGHGGHDRRRGVRHRGLPDAGRPDAGGERHLLRGDQQRHGPGERGVFGRGSHPGRLLHSPRGTGTPPSPWWASTP